MISFVCWEAPGEILSLQQVLLIPTAGVHVDKLFIMIAGRPLTPDLNVLRDPFMSEGDGDVTGIPDLVYEFGVCTARAFVPVPCLHVFSFSFVSELPWIFK